MRRDILIAGVILALIGIIIASIAAPFTEARHLTCPECGGDGKVGWWPFEETCSRCGGTGYITEAVMVGVGGSVLGFGLAVLGVIVVIIGAIAKNKGIVHPQLTNGSTPLIKSLKASTVFRGAVAVLIVYICFVVGGEMGSGVGAILGFGLAILIIKKWLFEKEITSKINYLKKNMVHKKCPQCGEPIQDEWELCPLCASPLTLQKSKCSNCDNEVEDGWKSCPFCGANLE